MPEVTDYDSLIAAMRARADQLGISRETVDSIAGWSDGLASKFLTGAPYQHRRPDGMRTAMRRLGPQSLGMMLAALGVRLVMTENPETLERYRDRREPRNESQIRVHDCSRKESSLK